MDWKIFIKYDRQNLTYYSVIDINVINYGAGSWTNFCWFITELGASYAINMVAINNGIWWQSSFLVIDVVVSKFYKILTMFKRFDD